MSTDNKRFLEEADNEVHAIWEQVSQTAQDLLRLDARWGFAEISFVENPSLEQLCNAAALLESLIDSVLGHRFGENYDETRRLLNCKTQVTNIHLIAAAVLANNEADYTLYLGRLRSQPPC